MTSRPCGCATVSEKSVKINQSNSFMVKKAHQIYTSDFQVSEPDWVVLQPYAPLSQRTVG